MGSFQQGFIRGTVRSSPFEIFLTRLLPTDEKTLAAFNAVVLPPGADVFAAKAKSKDFQPEDFIKTINEYRTSPLAQDMYSMLMSEHARAKFDEAKVKEVTDAFLSSARLWGDRWEARMEMTIAVNLLKGRQFPRLVPKYLDAAEKDMDEDLPAFQDALKSYREATEVLILIQDLAKDSASDQVKADAYTGLIEALKKQPFNPEILLALATDAERQGKGDAAIEYLSEIVALPMFEMQILAQRKGESPRHAEPHRITEKAVDAEARQATRGFRLHIDDVYQAKVGAFVEENANEGSRGCPKKDPAGKRCWLNSSRA